MASRNRTLQFAVTGSLLTLAPVAPVDSCTSIPGEPPIEELADATVDSPPSKHPDHDGGPTAPTDRIRAREGGPVVNPGPVPSGD